MHSEFEMSMMGELNFFLGLQIKQLKEGTFINQAKYIRDLLKRFNMEEAKIMKTPMNSSIKLDMDEKGKPVNSTMYRGMIVLVVALSYLLSFSFWPSPSPFYSIGWHQGERQALLGLRASTLLSHLSPSRRRHSLVRLRTISATSKNLPKGKSSQGKVSISPNFNTSGLRGYSNEWDGC
ncbi:hypothetical protein CK203_043943 [Vitis vinifera]|uniref:Reverse transcriptase Ty1/copia-type domain-containing protein n=1 Tax=Vitis vinifera TaxID=29760 RepID=A0A438HTJ4_VITVI|nr:hypothetical protein CK203_043943 [Vitis vinifera]